jgi:hypothetical protein
MEERMQRPHVVIATASLTLSTFISSQVGLTATRTVLIQRILDEDARLRKGVTLRFHKSPLSDVVAELGRQVGVALTADQDVADEPAIVYAVDQPARDVMRHLAQLFNYRWTRKGEPGRYTYEIYQDLKSKEEEEQLRQHDRARALEALQAAVQQYLELVQRTPEDLRKQADALEASHRTGLEHLAGRASQRPRAASVADVQALVSQEVLIRRLREAANPLQRVLIRLVASLTPPQWRALTSGGTLAFSTRRGPGAVLMPRALADELHTAHPTEGRPGTLYHFGGPGEEGMFRQVEEKLQADWSRAEAFQVCVWLDMGSGPFGALQMAARPGETPATQASLHVTPIAQMPADFNGSPPVPYGLLVVGQGVTAVRKESGEPKATEPATTEPSPSSVDTMSPESRDAALAGKNHFRLDLPIADPRAYLRVDLINEALPRIAETYGINLVADAYRQRCPFPPPVPSQDEQTLVEVLNQYVRPKAYWSREGNFIHVRRYTWYQDRLAEIPSRIIKHWTAHLKTQRQMSLRALASLALSLRDEQLEEFEALMHDQGIRLVTGAASREDFTEQVLCNKEILRTYGSLLAGQQHSLEAGGTVGYAAMPLEARRWLRVAVAQQQRISADRDQRRFRIPPSLSAEAVPEALSVSTVRFTRGLPAGRSYVRTDLLLHYRAIGVGALFYVFLPSVELDAAAGGNLEPLPAQVHGSSRKVIRGSSTRSK